MGNDDLAWLGRSRPERAHVHARRISASDPGAAKPLGELIGEREQPLAVVQPGQLAVEEAGVGRRLPDRVPCLCGPGWRGERRLRPALPVLWEQRFDFLAVFAVVAHLIALKWRRGTASDPTAWTSERIPSSGVNALEKLRGRMAELADLAAVEMLAAAGTSS